MRMRVRRLRLLMTALPYIGIAGWRVVGVFVKRIVSSDIYAGDSIRVTVQLDFDGPSWSTQATGVGRILTPRAAS